MSRRRFYSSALRRGLIGLSERFEGSRVSHYLDVLDETAAMPRLGLAQWQWDKLMRLLQHAYSSVPYYRRVFDRIDLTPADIRRPEDFARIPVLTKSDIRDNLDDLKATALPPGTRVVQAQTGGTTGEPLKFLRTTECNSLTRAALLRSYTWTGYRLGHPMLFLTGGSLLGSPQTWKQKAGFALMNYHFMPGFKLRAETLDQYVDTIRRKRIRFLRGYSTLLHQLAALCEARSIDDIRLDAVYPTAEMLTSAQRDTIERVFRTSVYDHYGCAEVNALANECPEGRRRHVVEEHVYMEEVSSQDLGENALVLTDLDNYAQPFIRYANGDRGRLSDDRCECKRNLRVLDEFLGRSSDAIVLADGQRYPGVFFHHLFGHFAGVDQFQVVQEAAGELLIRLAPNPRHSAEDEAEIKRLVAEHTGIIPVLERVDEIERSPSGKITSVICRVGA